MSSSQEELLRLYETPQVSSLVPQVATAAPLYPAEGMIRYAKSPWNPLGTGEGWVNYINGQWYPLQTTLGSLTTGGGTINGSLRVTGNVGIGTTAVPLTVGYTTVVIDGAPVGGDGGQLLLRHNAATSLELLGRGDSVRIATPLAVSMIFETNNTERLRISSSGGVGIGTSSPLNKLDIASGGSSHITVKDLFDNLARYDFGRDGLDGFFAFNGVQTTFSGYRWSINNGAEVMRINNAGNVGIGTSSPGAKLDVRGQFTSRIAGSGILQTAIDSVNSINWQVGSDGTAIYAGTQTNHALRLVTNNIERLRIDSNGNVRVGAALATNATDGFLYVPTCAGVPTGTPTAITGLAPIVINSTNNKLYFYSGGAWRDAGP